MSLSPELDTCGRACAQGKPPIPGEHGNSSTWSQNGARKRSKMLHPLDSAGDISNEVGGWLVGAVPVLLHLTDRQLCASLPACLPGGLLYIDFHPSSSVTLHGFRPFSTGLASLQTLGHPASTLPRVLGCLPCTLSVSLVKASCTL